MSAKFISNKRESIISVTNKLFLFSNEFSNDSVMYFYKNLFCYDSINIKTITELQNDPEFIKNTDSFIKLLLSELTFTELFELRLRVLVLFNKSNF
jgi:hypothetical protein